MSPALVFVGLLSSLVSALVIYRSKTLPEGKQFGGHGVFVDTSTMRWQGILVLVLGLAVLAVGFIL